MTNKKKSTKTLCPLCDRSFRDVSTDSNLIKNNGACLRCSFGKTKHQIQELILTKTKNKNQVLTVESKTGESMVDHAIKIMPSLPIKNFDLSNTKDKGVIAVVTINKSKCIEKMSFEELSTDKIDDNCNCAACQHHKNNDEMKVKSPAIFEGYEVNAVFIRNENASFDGGFDEEVKIKRTWQKPDGSAWVTFLSNQRLGFLDMRLSDFAKKYKAKPSVAAAATESVSFTTPWIMPKPISENDAPVSKSKVYFEGAKTDKVVGSTRASDERRFFYITFSYFIGGKRGHRKGYTSHRTFNNEMFNIEKVSKEIKKELKAKNIKNINVLVENWKEVNKNEYVQLMRFKK